MPKSKSIFGIVSIFLSLGIMLFFIFKTKGLEKLHDAIGSIQYIWLIIAMLFMILYVLFESTVLFLLTRKVKKGYKFLKALKASTIGLYYSALTPFASGGQPMQLYAMKLDGVDVASGGAILVMKAIIYQVSMTVYAFVSIVKFHSFFNEKIHYFDLVVIVGLIVNIAIVATVYLVMVRESITKKIANIIVSVLSKINIIKDKDASLKSIYDQINDFHLGAERYNKALKTTIITFFITFFQFTAYFLIPYFIYKGFNIGNVNVVYFIAAQSMLTMLASFMPTPGGSGATEGGFYMIFKLFFLEATIIPAMILWRFITYYSLIIIGGFVSLFFNSIEEKTLESAE